jgi:Domain of unknown function (DUF4259)
MGAWGSEPFDNDTAADWAWELDDSSDWEVVRSALNEALEPGDFLDADVATSAIAAASVVAGGLAYSPPLGGKTASSIPAADVDDDEDEPLESDEDENDEDEDSEIDDSVGAFLARAGEPPTDLVDLALRALDAASGSTSELADLWAESDATEWKQSNAKLRTALGE